MVIAALHRQLRRAVEKIGLDGLAIRQAVAGKADNEAVLLNPLVRIAAIVR